MAKRSAQFITTAGELTIEFDPDDQTVADFGGRAAFLLANGALSRYERLARRYDQCTHKVLVMPSDPSWTGHCLTCGHPLRSNARLEAVEDHA